jgi:hypothetical protein
MKTSEVFRRARRRIWEGRYSKTGPQSRFICYAILFDATATPKERRKAIDIVTKRLHPYHSMEDWLMARGVSAAQVLTVWKMQAHRKAWLTMLIKEFEAKGD